jgi:hypothetical protein
LDGEIKNGEPQCKEEEDSACFKHSQSLEPEDVLRMKVVAGGRAGVGIAAEEYDVERHRETHKSTAGVDLDGTTAIYSGISKDGEGTPITTSSKTTSPRLSPTTWPFASTRTAICHSFGSTRMGSGTTLHRRVGPD